MNLSDLTPYSDEAEQSVIGALLLDNTAHDKIAGRLTAGDFYRDSHRCLYARIVAMIEAGQSVDVVTLFESLERSGDLERVGGLAYIGALASNTPSAYNIRRYAEIVRDRSMRRALMAAGNQLNEFAVSRDGETAEEKIERSITLIQSIAEGATKDSGPVMMDAALGATLERMQATLDGTGPKRRQTGLADLDARLYDLTEGALVIVAGRPGMGKTSMALKIARTVSVDGDPGAVAVFSMEMPTTQVTQRIVSAETGIAMHRLINPVELTEHEWSEITACTARLCEQHIAIDDTAALSVGHIRARCNQLRRKYGLKLVVIDYLQLMAGKGENRNQVIGSISRGLKALAKELKVPVIALSQLSRNVENRAEKRPLMADLRESGEIEQDADLILFCYRDEIYHPDTPDKGTAEIICAKQRNGESGWNARVAWKGSSATFEDLAHGWQPTEQPRRVLNGRKAGFD